MIMRQYVVQYVICCFHLLAAVSKVSKRMRGNILYRALENSPKKARALIG